MKRIESNRRIQKDSDRCVSPSGCLPSRMAIICDAQGVAIGVYLLRHSVPSGGVIQSLKGSDRYTLRHRRRFSIGGIAFSSHPSNS